MGGSGGIGLTKMRALRGTKLNELGGFYGIKLQVHG
jgi:hypothetical protein